MWFRIKTRLHLCLYHPKDSLSSLKTCTCSHFVSLKRWKLLLLTAERSFLIYRLSTEVEKIVRLLLQAAEYKLSSGN
jgi:hypothetical protein